MTFLMRQNCATPDVRRRMGSHVSVRRAWLVAAAGTALVAGFAAGHIADVASRPVAIDAGLITILRFMALVKLAMVLGAVALTIWRLGHSTSPRLAQSYVLATMLMACGPGLIWSTGTVVYGAISFHAGLFSYLVLACRDDGTPRVSRVAGPSRHRVRRGGLSAPSAAEATPR